MSKISIKKSEKDKIFPSFENDYVVAPKKERKKINAIK